MRDGLRRERLAKRQESATCSSADQQPDLQFRLHSHLKVARYAVRLCISVSDSFVMMSIWACSGSVISILGTPCSRVHVFVDPSARRSVTSKSVTRRGAPWTFCPEGSVTVA